MKTNIEGRDVKTVTKVEAYLSVTDIAELVAAKLGIDPSRIESAMATVLSSYLTVVEQIAENDDAISDTDNPDDGNPLGIEITLKPGPAK